MRSTRLCSLAAVLAALELGAACGKRADPLPPLRRAPQPVVSLAVAQRGDSVVVSYQASRTYTDGARLGIHDVELLRADREGDLLKVAQVKTRSVAPGELIVETEPAPAVGTVLRYAVRARLKRQLSQLASAPPLTIVSAPRAPSALLVKTGPQGLHLTWKASAEIAIPAFWIYRREQVGRFSRPLNATPIDATSYDDATVGMGEKYCYVVRTVAQTEPVVESAPSEEVCQEARDVTPPAAPLGGAVYIAQAGVTVSWSPSPEADLAGYRVYLLQPDGRRERLAELPATETSYKDDATVARRVYVVCAVDKSGNESSPSSALEARRP